MDQTIPFPKNFDSYVSMAMEAFQYGDFHQAVEYLTKALAIQMNEELLQLCLTIMQDTEQYAEGIQLLKYHKSELWDSTDGTSLDLQLITFLIYAEDLNEAKNQISRRKKGLLDRDEDTHLYDILQQNLNIIEEKQIEERNKKIALLREESKIILHKGYHQQAIFLKKYTILPEKEFIAISQAFLVEKSIHAFLKTDILQILIQKEIDEQINISKEIYSKIIDLKKLYPIHKSPLLIKSEHFFAKNHSQNPEVQKQMESNFFLHCAYFYPFEKEALQSVEKWQEAMNELTFPPDSPINRNEERVIKNIQLAEKNLNILTEM